MPNDQIERGGRPAVVLALSLVFLLLTAAATVTGTVPARAFVIYEWEGVCGNICTGTASGVLVLPALAGLGYLRHRRPRSA